MYAKCMVHKISRFIALLILEENAVQYKLSKIRYTKIETNLLLTHNVGLFTQINSLQNEHSE
jgi:hypothetical protein